MRLVADVVRGKTVEDSQAILKFAVKKGANPILKLLNSAVASAKVNFQKEAGDLYIAKITVDEGPKLKRWMPRARGSASPIQKKTSHITLVLEETKGPKKVRETKKEIPVANKEVVAPKEGKSPITHEKPKFNFETGKPKPRKTDGFRRIFRRKAV